MKAITFVLTLEEPFLATQVNNNEPNSGISYPFVPGSMIRGALIRNYLNGRSDLDLPADNYGRTLFLDGTVRYLNAYLYDAGRKLRLLPKPLSWFVEKSKIDDEDVTIADFAVKPNWKREKALDNPKAPGGGAFVEMIDAKPLIAEPDYHVTVHNTTDEPGKKKEGVSQMYRYEALAPGQQFQGVILADDGVELTDIREWLEDVSLALGGSSTGGYGLVKVSEVSEPIPNWQEYTAESARDEVHIVTCLSDLIVRSDSGQVTAAMADALGVDAEHLIGFQEVRVVGGFNQKWGLPLQQSWAIKAGSVFRIDTRKSNVAETALKNLVDTGVGERTAEGFGRIALNWHTKADRQRFQLKPDREKEGEKTVSEVKHHVEGYGLELAQQMAKRRLRQQLETKLAELVHQKGQKLTKTRLPSATQLSRVRLAARHALAQQNLEVIKAHLDSLKGSRSQWQGAKVDGDDLFEWIRTQSNFNEEQFQTLFKIKDRLPQVARIEATVPKELVIEFRARLIDGVMKLAVEQKKAENGNGNQEGGQ
ncbi:MAG: hypothetical protein H6656_00755 [Ardenticatenaceae bacterium]|nr:hypothetical protein [Anaerolineales bacterium]MCB9005914.1 hypothetical protein [Ardenticatenaceae bacterium]